MKLATLPEPAPRAEEDVHRGVRVFADYAGPVRDRCDVLVVGSGPGGAVVAKELAERGRDVILLEEGPPFGAKDFRQEPGSSMRRTLREAGLRTTRGTMFIPTMQAIGLGGGSLINSAICARAPGFVFDKWAERTGVRGLTQERLAPHFERVEQFLGVEPTPLAVQGERNLVFKRGCEALGYSCEPTRRNVRGCRGSAECFTGCRNHAKVSTDRSYVPAALRAGARVYTSVRGERLLLRGTRVVGMTGHVVEPFSWREGHEVHIDADTVVLAAGCMATPLVLQRSGVGSRRWVGEDLGLHPGLAIMAIFPHAVRPWEGATQGYHSLHFLEEGLKLEVLWAPPAVLAARLPGLGHDYQRHLMEYERMAPFDVIAATQRSTGSVRPRGRTWEPDIRYELHQDDVARIQRGVALLADIAWAAGAEEILPGLHGVPERLRSREESSVLRTRRLHARDTITAANHAFGTTRMAGKAEDGVVDEDGRCFGVDNLYVADTGIFPGSPAVNPMLTCMALADHVAERVHAAMG